MRYLLRIIVGCLTLTTVGLVAAAESLKVDVSQVDSTSEVLIDNSLPGHVTAQWPIDKNRIAAASFRLSSDGPLIESLSLSNLAGNDRQTIARDLTPFTAITVGTRNLDTPGGWTIFFDKVHQRPYQRHAARLDLKSVKAHTHGSRGSLTFGKLTAGPFSGELVFSFVAGSPLILAEAVVSTSEDRRALLYDAGLVAAPGNIRKFSWYAHGDRQPKSEPAGAAAADRAVRLRTIVAESTSGGAVAVFPPPHRFFYPLDFADNFGFNWFGRDYKSAPTGDGWGVRQPPEGDRRFVPWVNAPPGTSQRLGVFYLLDTNAASALQAVSNYTHNDHYPTLPGYKTFTSHYHIEHTLDLLKQQAATGTSEIPPGLVAPGFKKVFRETGVDIVHLAEFHNGMTPKLGAAERLKQLRTLHAECERLSDDQFLLLPGEEPNVHLGGHWISLFPKPVLWVLNRAPDEPFTETTAAGETVYRVGSPSDVLALMQREQGLMWTAHARIKSSVGFPDGYREQEFFKSPQFLGAAWKAMPADYSHDTLGRRVLDLCDDMNNWGAPKQVIGEVDIFQVQPGYEFYGHANINYVKLDRLPKFQDGWASLLKALRDGQFFTTTGEILIADCSFTRAPNKPAIVQAHVQGTFPLSHADIIGGDGRKVHRQRFDLSQSREFSNERHQWRLNDELAACDWIRVEVWDVATNGAFTQPMRKE